MTKIEEDRRRTLEGIIWAIVCLTVTISMSTCSIRMSIDEGNKTQKERVEVEKQILQELKK